MMIRWVRDPVESSAAKIEISIYIQFGGHVSTTHSPAARATAGMGMLYRGEQLSAYRLARRIFGRPLRSAARRMLRVPIGRRAILKRHKQLFGEPLELRDPQSFTARLFVQMIETNRSCDPVQTRLADKLLARDFVAARIGKDYLVNLLWHGSNPAMIPFARLPSSFVIKTNHASGQVITVDGDHDAGGIVRQLSSWLKQNFYWCLHEGQYYRIAPRVLVEEYLKDGANEPLVYRLWCFNGEVAIIQVDDTTAGGNDVMSFYDTDWRKLDLQYRPDAYHRDFARPAGLREMTRVASRLSQGFPFVRVDLYDIAGRIYFGEMTFTPRGGELWFDPPHWDVMLGQKWADRLVAPEVVSAPEPLVPAEDEVLPAMA
jgi:hypothetical protein